MVYNDIKMCAIFHCVPPIMGQVYDNAHVSIVFYAYRLREKACLVFQKVKVLWS